MGELYDGEKGVVSAYYNNSETFMIETRIDTRLETQGLPLPNRITGTDEFGLKFDMLNGRFVGTVAVFDSEESNFLLSLRDDLAGTVTGIPAPEGSILGEPYLAPAGTRTTKGWDIDVAMNPLEGLNMIVSYGEVDAEITEGRVTTVPGYTVGAFVKYEFQEGPLEGFSAAWQYNEWGESEANPNFGLPATELPSWRATPSTIFFWAIRCRRASIFV